MVSTAPAGSGLDDAYRRDPCLARIEILLAAFATPELPACGPDFDRAAIQTSLLT